VQWLEQFLARYPGTVIAVTHDRYFLDNVAGWILELDRGYGIPWRATIHRGWSRRSSAWVSRRSRRPRSSRRCSTSSNGALQSQGAPGQEQGAPARFEELESQEFQKRNETNEIYIPPGPHLGGLVVEAEGLRKSFRRSLVVRQSFVPAAAGASSA